MWKENAMTIEEDEIGSEDYSKWITKVKRPNWDEYFLAINEVVKTRSLDANTKHAVTLVDENHHIVGTGYNSFPSGFPDKELPNTRVKDVEPLCPKYHFMVHAEENAISNLTTKSYEYLTCYAVGVPCVRCLRLLIQNRVQKIVVASDYGWTFSEDEKPYFNTLLLHTDMTLETLTHCYNPERGTWYRIHKDKDKN